MKEQQQTESQNVSEEDSYIKGLTDESVAPGINSYK